MTGMGKTMLPLCDNKPCKKPYVPKTSWQRFCSTACHEDYHCREKKEQRAKSKK